MSFQVSTYLPSYDADIFHGGIQFRKCAQATFPLPKAVDNLTSSYGLYYGNYVRLFPFVT